MKTMMNTKTKSILLLIALFLATGCSSDDETTAPPDPSAAFVGNYQTKAYQLHVSGAYNLNLNVDGGTNIEIEASPNNPEEIVIEGLDIFLADGLNALIDYQGGTGVVTVAPTVEAVGKVNDHAFSFPETDFLFPTPEGYELLVLSGNGTLENDALLFEFEYEITTSQGSLFFSGEVEMEKQ